jgi:hypothetical protein
VPVEDFCGPEAEERLQDLAWIGPRVIRHQEVVSGVMQHSPVLPARFGTIFLSPANLEGVLHRHHQTISGFLERSRDQKEWAVKALLNRPAAKEKLVASRLKREADRLACLSPGQRYFQEQRLRAACEQELQKWLQEVATELWTELGNCAAAVRERRLLSRGVTGSDQDMVLNWAFLVPEETASRFQARFQVARDYFSDRGLVLECSGPWPPYSFSPPLDPDSAA